MRIRPPAIIRFSALEHRASALANRAYAARDMAACRHFNTKLLCYFRAAEAIFRKEISTYRDFG